METEDESPANSKVDLKNLSKTHKILIGAISSVGLIILLIGIIYGIGESLFNCFFQ